MIESRIRVELTKCYSAENPFFGATTTKKVYEETITHDKDKRDNVAPFGIVANVPINDDMLHIKVTARYFDIDDFGVYSAFFDFDNKVFELSVSVNEDNNDIENITLYVWLDNNSFESGVDAEETYTTEDFTSYGKYFL
jgi:hypothetical protein